MPSADALRRAQFRYDAEEAPVIDGVHLEETAIRLVSTFEPGQFYRFVLAVERETGARDLSDSSTLRRVWEDHQPPFEEE